MDQTDRFTKSMARSLLAILRRIFRRCHGRPVNHLSRQMTPDEAVDLHARMAAHGVPDDEETRDDRYRAHRVAR